MGDDLIWYTNTEGREVWVEEMEWLEDAETVEGVSCSRYWIGGEESIWLDENSREVEDEIY
jgi:hypothetical protein